jgi:hypothetical protein
MPVRTWEDTIKVELKDILCEDVDWIHLAHDGNHGEILRIYIYIYIYIYGHLISINDENLYCLNEC